MGVGGAPVGGGWVSGSPLRASGQSGHITRDHGPPLTLKSGSVSHA